MCELSYSPRYCTDAVCNLGWHLLRIGNNLVITKVLAQFVSLRHVTCLIHTSFDRSVIPSLLDISAAWSASLPWKIPYIPTFCTSVVESILRGTEARIAPRRRACKEKDKDKDKEQAKDKESTTVSLPSHRIFWYMGCHFISLIGTSTDSAAVVVNGKRNHISLSPSKTMCEYKEFERLLGGKYQL